ncbi:MAG: bifunctional protein PutA [Paracoccaceae bacterium]|nr:MAG: bifunctional protein PutA [Paracoccaceae bacterium]
MQELGNQFVLGQTIDEAIARARGAEARGFTHSYDMLGEAARTAADAEAYRRAYANAIARLAAACRRADVRDNPGISVKLSALHPRYEAVKRDRLMAELVPVLRGLAEAARAHHMGFNIDAEEADRLDISLDIIEAVLASPGLAGWDGFGVVVQAYGRRAGAVLDWLNMLAARLDRRIMVRLVKGAYWDSEIKRAQVEGLPDFPVFTRKATTDVAYLCCAQRLMGMTDRIYPQFATHNAHTVAAILAIAPDRDRFEFQRLHGMGEALHDLVRAEAGTRCRIYAPVGAHRDLLAYLVRRLLENGANSSFVHRIVDESVPAREVAADPFTAPGLGTPNPVIRRPPDLFAPERRNSRGVDLNDPVMLREWEAARAPFRTARWSAAPLGAVPMAGGAVEAVRSPFDPGDVVGEVRLATAADVDAALAAAEPWTAPAAERRAVLVRASELFEANAGEFAALLAREAGKTPRDAVAELREAVDFLRYYGARSVALTHPPRGRFVCISPWNFPLAIFTGQVAAALAAGNAVLAKPAEATPLVAALATRLLHEAGVPRAALALLPGPGGEIGAALVSDPRVDGIAFTGSTATARAIERAAARHLAHDAVLIAETGGLNAMIVDSTALPEQAVRDIITSAFQSAGQRCSALRMLYVQEEVAGDILRMLSGAMEELALGDPWSVATDVGPVISAAAAAGIRAHVDAHRAAGRVLKELSAPSWGHFVAPAVIRLAGIHELEREVFGPVLHVATYRAEALEEVIAAINATGYGLTFGMHSRIDDRVQMVAERIEAGNIYINRNQIGAVVGSQPFGGHGLSGTGPKAGGPHYLPRFCRVPVAPPRTAPRAAPADPAAVERLLAAARPEPGERFVALMPGPTGESNRLSLVPRGRVLCLGPGAEAAAAQARQARDTGCAAVMVAAGARGPGALDGELAPADLTRLTGFDAVAFWGDAETARALRRALAAREGPILPLLTEADIRPRCVLEKHLCIDTTAAGGNASLLAAAG